MNKELTDKLSKIYAKPPKRSLGEIEKWIEEMADKIHEESACGDHHYIGLKDGARAMYEHLMPLVESYKELLHRINEEMETFEAYYPDLEVDFQASVLALRGRIKLSEQALSDIGLETKENDK